MGSLFDNAEVGRTVDRSVIDLAKANGRSHVFASRKNVVCLFGVNVPTTSRILPTRANQP